MQVYHGSFTEIFEIDLSKSQLNKDFGKGFYVTKFRNHAESWAINIAHRYHKEPFITEFTFFERAFEENRYKVLRFDDYNQDWLDFVVMNRNPAFTINQHDFDLIEGPIADDKVQNRINDFLVGMITKNDLLEELKYHEKTHQICFCTINSLQLLKKIDNIYSSYIVRISESIIENLITDFNITDEQAVDIFYTSKTFSLLSDKTTELYNKDWKEIYQMLTNEQNNVQHTFTPTLPLSLTLFFLLFSLSPFLLFSQPSPTVILHTNDTHSHLEQYNDPKEGDVGGIARRNTFIQETRKKYPNTIVVDAGDFSQGTPYFNLFKGFPEIELMNAIGYDVVALGNHEFDNGSKALAKRLKLADFEIVCANIQCKNKTLSKIIKPYAIMHTDDKKIGFFGLLCDLKSITMPEYYKEITFFDPIAAAQKTVEILKNKEQCDYIICLSHLGFEEEIPDNITDSILAEQVTGIDFIIGGHTHLILKEPVIVNGAKIVQAGKNGTHVGKLKIIP